MKKLSHYMYLGFVLVLVPAAILAVDEIDHKKYSFTASERSPLKIRLEIDAGKVEIKPGTDEKNVDIDFRYDLRRHEVSVDFDDKKNELNAYFDLKKWFKNRKDEKDHDYDDDSHSSAKMVVTLPTEVPVELYCKIKAGETEVELGGIHLKSLKLNVLAGETSVSFSQPNQLLMKELLVESKVGELRIEKLGNANFEYANIEGSIGELSIDLAADMELETDREMEISLSIGQTRLYLPRDEAVRFSVSKFLFFSELDIPADFSKEGKYYYSDGYNRAKHKTQLSISPGLGTLDIRVR